MNNQPEAPLQEALTSNQQPQVLTVEEVAALLRVNRKTAYEAVRRGELPGVRRIGGTIRISRQAVLDWLTEGQACVSRSSRSPR